MKCRRFFYTIAKSKHFERFIIVCIALNSLALAVIWFEQPSIVGSVTEIVQYVFTVIFTIEVIIKIIAYGKRYFIDPWHIFDILVVVGSIAG